MSDIKTYVENALKNAEGIVANSGRHRLTDYVRGRADGSITAYQHVLVELRPQSERKSECRTEMSIFDTWVSDVCEASPLTAGGAIEIYMFLDRENIPITDLLLRFVIQLSLSGKGRYEITQTLKYEKLRDKVKKRSMWNISRYPWGNK